MNTFLVTFKSAASLRLGRPRNFVQGDKQLTVLDGFWRSPHGGPEIHAGLLLAVTLPGDDPMGAAATASAFIEPIVDQLSAAHGTAIDDPYCLLSVQADPGLDERRFAHVIENCPPFGGPRRDFDIESFDPLFRSLDELGASHPRDARRVYRAIHHLRRSSLDLDSIDHFEDLWEGIEVLDPVLVRRHQIATTQASRCPHCAEAIDLKAGTPSVEYIVTTLLGRALDEAKHLRRKRNQIAHSGDPWKDIKDELPELTNLARQVLVHGILEVINLPGDDRKRFPISVLTNKESPQFVVTGAFRHLPPDSLSDLARLPRLQLSYVESLVPVDNDSSHPFRGANFMQLVLEANPWNDDCKIDSQVHTWFPTDPGRVDSPPHVNAIVLRTLPPSTTPNGG